MGIAISKAPTLTNQAGRTVLATWTKLSDSKGSTFKVKSGSKNVSKKVTYYDACTGYEVRWQYGLGTGSWSVAEVKKINSKSTLFCEYTPPDNAIKVKCTVIPLFGTYQTLENDKTVKKSYYTGSGTRSSIRLAKNALDAPPVPSITVKGTTATITTSYTSSYCGSITFKYRINGGAEATKTVTGKSGSGTWSLSVEIGAGASVSACAMANVASTAKAYSSSGYSDWSNDSDASTPGKPSNLQVRAADTDNTVLLTWEAPSGGASEYDIQYVHTSAAMFNSSDVRSNTTTETEYYITGLDVSQKWYFRVRSVTASGNSGWVTYGESTSVSGDDGSGSSGSSAAVSTDPTAPSTFQSDSIAAKGESVTLGWVHNCEDGCTATASTLYISKNGGAYAATAIAAGTYRYQLDTSAYADGDKVSWYVTTTAVNGSISPASAVRTVEVFEAPSVRVSVAAEITALPVEITVANGGSSGAAVAYECTVTATEAYEAVSTLGETVRVSAGQAVWSGREETTADSHVFSIGAGDALIAHDQTYEVTATIATRSGLRSETAGRYAFKASLQSSRYSIACDINARDYAYTCDIVPMAYLAEDGTTVPEGVRLAVMRLESGGGLVPIAVNIPNGGGVTVPDLHPRLDTATYRVTATDTATGAVEFEDFSAEMGVERVVVQWAEAASGQDPDGAVSFEGRRLELPYNVSLQEDYSPDVALVEYIGRSHPVAYYGTQRGATSSCTAEFWKDDAESIALLRELAAYRGDCYVREPSGTGYWAQANVSISSDSEGETVTASLSFARVDRTDSPLEVS